MMEQRSEEWFQTRLGKVTASRVSDVMMKPTTAGFRNYAAQLVAERLTGTAPEGFSSAAMQWGTDHEPEARAAYIFYQSARVSEIAFVDHPQIKMSGASPDGLVGDKGLVEIKCPNTATHIDTLSGGKVDPKYIKQMQWQMACAGREWCDFVSYDPRLPVEMQMHVERVERDKEQIAEMETAVSDFLSKIEKTVDFLTDTYLKKDAA